MIDVIGVENYVTLYLQTKKKDKIRFELVQQQHATARAQELEALKQLYDEHGAQIQKERSIAEAMMESEYASSKALVLACESIVVASEL